MRANLGLVSDNFAFKRPLISQLTSHFQTILQVHTEQLIGRAVTRLSEYFMFKSRANQIRHSAVTGLPRLQKFLPKELCCLGVNLLHASAKYSEYKSGLFFK